MKFTKETLKRMLSIVLTAAMVITSVSLPQVSPKVYAESSISAPAKATFLTNEQLRTLAQNSDGEPYYVDSEKKKFQKAYFAGKTWDVIGSEKVNADDTLVLLSDSQITTSKFADSLSTYSKSTIYYDLNANVSPRKDLKYNVNTLFGTNAKAYVKPMNVSSAASSCLYIPDGNKEDSSHFTVGSNNQYKIPISAWSLDNCDHGVVDFFWLRSSDGDQNALSVSPTTNNGCVISKPVNTDTGSVVPAFNLILSSALFASAASAATSGAGIDSGNVMTFRFDSAKDANGNAVQDRISATAKVNKSGVTISNVGTDEYLYVQWNDGEKDKLYSCAAANEIVSAATIGGEEFELTHDCKIWIEKKIDNIVYAKNIEFVRTYWTKDELKSLGNDYVYYADSIKKFQKANYANKTWYVIGSEKVGEDDTLVLLSDSKIGTSIFDTSSSEYSSSYIYKGLNSADDGCIGFDYNVNKLFAGEAIAYVKPVGEFNNIKSYLYLPKVNDSGSDKYNFTVGSNNQYKIPISTWTSNNSNHGVALCFWLRSDGAEKSAFAAYTGSNTVSNTSCSIGNSSVVPAFNLKLSSVLFASAAPAATSEKEAVIDQNNVMTFRFDSAKDANGAAVTDRISATATANKSGVTISGAGEGEYLYVQWNDGKKDNVYSCAAANGTVSASTIGGGEFEITPNCKIWIEKKVDEIVYAKEIIAHKHVWSYDSEEAKLIATCSGNGCTIDGNKVSLTLSAESKTYDGKAATVNVGTEDEQSAWTNEELTLPTVSYEYRANSEGTYSPVSEAKNAGFYKASISAGGKTVSVEFEITKQQWNTKPVAKTDDYNFGETVSTPQIESFDLDPNTVTYYYNTENSNSGGKLWTGLEPKTLKHGTYYLYAVIEASDNQESYTTDTTSFKVNHLHDYSLRQSESENAVIATCNNTEDPCEGDIKEIKLKTADTVYTGQPYEPSGVATFESESGKTASVTYKKDSSSGEALTGAPTNAGKYWAELNVEGVTVSSEFNISKKLVAAPTAGNETYTYNGEVQKYKFAEEGDSDWYTVTDNEKKDAGNYSVKLELNDKYNTVWADNNVVPKTFTFSIAPKKVDIPSLISESLTYNGNKQNFLSGEFKSELYSVESGSFEQKDAGSYSVELKLNDKNNTVWDDEKVENKIYNFAIAKKPVKAPTAGNKTYTYNGEVQTYKFAEEGDSDWYTVTDNNKTEAGEHTVTVSLSDPTNTVWADNNVEPKTFTFSIAPKKVDIPSLISESLTYNGNKQNFLSGEFKSELYSVESGSFEQKDAGSYSVELKLNDKNNTVWADEKVENKIYNFAIAKKPVKAPTAGNKAYTFNLKPQTYEFGDVGDSDWYNVRNNTMINAGNKEVVVELNDKANTYWESEENAEDLKFTFTINPMAIPVPVGDPRTFYFNGNNQTYGAYYLMKAADNFLHYYDYSGIFYKIVNNTQTDVADYKVTVTPMDNYCWSDGTDVGKEYDFTINNKKMNARIYYLYDKENNRITDGYVYGKYLSDIENPENLYVKKYYTPYIYNLPAGAKYTFYVCANPNDKANSIEWDNLTFASIPATNEKYRTLYVYAKVTCGGYDNYETPVSEFKVYTPSEYIYIQSEYKYTEQTRVKPQKTFYGMFGGTIPGPKLEKTEYTDIKTMCFCNTYDCIKAIINEVKGNRLALYNQWGKAVGKYYKTDSIESLKGILKKANLMEDQLLSTDLSTAKLMGEENEPDIAQIVSQLEMSGTLDEKKVAEFDDYEEILCNPYSEANAKVDEKLISDLLELGEKSKDCEVIYDLGYAVNEEDEKNAVYKTETVSAGEKLTKPEDPTVKGGSFAGWYYYPSSAVKKSNAEGTTLDIEKDGEPWDFDNNEVQDNMTLYAIWRSISFTSANEGNSLEKPIYGIVNDIKLGTLSTENFSKQVEYTAEIYNEEGTEKLNEKDTGIKLEAKNCAYDEQTKITTADLYVETSAKTPAGKYLIKVIASDGTNSAYIEGGELNVAIALDEEEMKSLTEEEKQKVTEAVENTTKILNSSDLSTFNGDGANQAVSESIKTVLGDKCYVSVVPKNVVFEKISGLDEKIKEIKYDVKPMNGSTVVENSSIAKPITFRLPVPDSMDCTTVEVFHTEKSIGTYIVQGDSPYRYVEITSQEFSYYTIQAISSGETIIAKNLTTKECFFTLNQALDGAKSGEVIGLLSNTRENIVIPSYKKITLDLNGKELKGNITNYGDLTIKDSSFAAGPPIKIGTGKVDGKIIEINSGKLTIESGKFNPSQETSDKNIIGNRKGAIITGNVAEWVVFPEGMNLNFTLDYKVFEKKADGTIGAAVENKDQLAADKEYIAKIYMNTDLGSVKIRAFEFSALYDSSIITVSPYVDATISKFDSFDRSEAGKEGKLYYRLATSDYDLMSVSNSTKAADADNTNVIAAFNFRVNGDVVKVDDTFQFDFGGTAKGKQAYVSTMSLINEIPLTFAEPYKATITNQLNGVRILDFAYAPEGYKLAVIAADHGDKYTATLDLYDKNLGTNVPVYFTDNPAYISHSTNPEGKDITGNPGQTKGVYLALIKFESGDDYWFDGTDASTASEKEKFFNNKYVKSKKVDKAAGIYDNELASNLYGQSVNYDGVVDFNDASIVYQMLKYDNSDLSNIKGSKWGYNPADTSLYICAFNRLLCDENRDGKLYGTIEDVNYILNLITDNGTYSN